MCQICVTCIWASDYKQRLPDLSTNSAANSSKYEQKKGFHLLRHTFKGCRKYLACLNQSVRVCDIVWKDSFSFAQVLLHLHMINVHRKHLSMWVCVSLQWRGACTPCRRELRCPKWKERRTASSGSFTWTSTSPASGGDPPRNRTRPKVSYQHRCFWGVAQLYQDKMSVLLE